tara:strand:+ start:5641 stop:7098 length:1458 start_codon:yes stop_codon:yes gene_type:complete
MIKEQIKLRNKLAEIQKTAPLAVSKLWTPYCHRYDGLASKSPRKKGCGGPMIRLFGNTWECKKCDIREERTSQIDAFLNLGSEATAVFGGNRAGKSEIGAMFSVATAAGSDTWWVKEWLKINNLPKDLIQKKPSKVLVSALSYSDAIAYVRPKISKYLPAGTKEKNWNNHGRSSVTLPNGGKIISMSADSGRKKYQGISCKLAWLDEEHPQEIFEECMLRTIDTRGIVFITMTPLLGITWPNEVFIQNNQDPSSFKYHMLSGLDNPWVSSVKMRKAVNHLSQEAQDSRLYGRFTNQTGLVYPEINQSLHVVKPFSIPDHWKIYLTVDFGVVNPFACLCVAHDESDNTLYVIGEYFKTGETTIHNGNMVRKKFDKYGKYTYVVADPESKDGRMLLARHCGLPNKPAPKHIGVINSINLVKERLTPDADGKPHLFIFNNCKELLKEFRLYSWNKNTTGKDTVKKQHDHGLDALRYLVAFLYRLNRHY